MKQFWERIRTLLTLLGLLAGLASVTYGAALIYRPAGFIVGGILAAVLAVLTILGEETDNETGQGH